MRIRKRERSLNIIPGIGNTRGVWRINLENGRCLMIKSSLENGRGDWRLNLKGKKRERCLLIKPGIENEESGWRMKLTKEMGEELEDKILERKWERCLENKQYTY